MAPAGACRTRRPTTSIGLQTRLWVFTITIDQRVGKAKLSQNRIDGDRAGVAEGLRAIGRAAHAERIDVTSTPRSM